MASIDSVDAPNVNRHDMPYNFNIRKSALSVAVQKKNNGEDSVDMNHEDEGKAADVSIIDPLGTERVTFREFPGTNKHETISTNQ